MPVLNVTVFFIFIMSSVHRLFGISICHVDTFSGKSFTFVVPGCDAVNKPSFKYC
jgi:hypothetical protein